MPDEPELSFEEVLGELERIVENLERGEPELTAALARYENGVRLLAHCHRLLDQAEHSVALLGGVDEEGNPLTAPFDATATIAREPGPDAPIPTRPQAGPRNPNRQAPIRSARSKNRAAAGEDAERVSDPPF
jgi:exodeoxyribonuclease VII small subunit